MKIKLLKGLLESDSAPSSKELDGDIYVLDGEYYTFDGKNFVKVPDKFKSVLAMERNRQIHNKYAERSEDERLQDIKGALVGSTVSDREKALKKETRNQQDLKNYKSQELKKDRILSKGLNGGKISDPNLSEMLRLFQEDFAKNIETSKFDAELVDGEDIPNVDYWSIVDFGNDSSYESPIPFDTGPHYEYTDDVEEEKPYVFIYFDRSGSFTSGNAKNAPKVKLQEFLLSLFDDYADSVILEPYYFANNVYDNPQEAEAEGGTVLDSVVEHLSSRVKGHVANAIIVTDNDANWCNLTAPELDGTVWLIFCNTYSNTLQSHIYGSRTRQFFFTTDATKSLSDEIGDSLDKDKNKDNNN